MVGQRFPQDAQRWDTPASLLFRRSPVIRHSSKEHGPPLDVLCVRKTLLTVAGARARRRAPLVRPLPMEMGSAEPAFVFEPQLSGASRSLAGPDRGRRVRFSCRLWFRFHRSSSFNSGCEPLDRTRGLTIVSGARCSAVRALSCVLVVCSRFRRTGQRTPSKHKKHMKVRRLRFRA